ncbi:Porin P precursor [Botrimarina colliarenosi]|uniref:Porin P n=1 Tax=Botrimarina colliarenosi TaxID=2528001 RepID=A0A5C6AF99_9BACT|nr:porin [Botrimarina colliarenosi]TWT98110.1 Porin P precursor [Botrimarina colliarenosi]
MTINNFARRLASAAAATGLLLTTAFAQDPALLQGHSAYADLAAQPISELNPPVDDLTLSEPPEVAAGALDGVVFDASLLEAGCWRCVPCTPGADPAGKGFPTVAVTGFFQADAIWFAQDATNRAVVGDAQDLADFRRARLAAKGAAAENVTYLMEYDFAFPGRPSFMDVWVDFADLADVGNLRVGQFRQPFGMDALTSVREMMFLERSLPFALVPFRQIGASLYDTAYDERMTWAIAGYRFPTDVFGNASGDSGYGMSTRETVLLYDGGCGRTVHVGAGYTYNEPSTNAARIRTGPEVGATQLDFSNATNFPVPFFVDSGAIAADSYQVYNLELAGSRGAWLFQSEYFGAKVDPIAGGGVNFDGAYAQVAYALTGENHAYSKAQGVYTRIVPHKNYGDCGLGAFEVAGRWSYLDLDDGAVNGGTITDYTLGLNWYLNRYTKFQFNYIHANLDRPTAVSSDADVFAMRAQLDF